MSYDINQYKIKNNVLVFFMGGPFTQWYGGFKNQSGGFDYPIEEFYPYLLSDNPVNFMREYDSNDIFSPSYIHFNCAEQAMMFGKAVIFDDMETAEKILKTQHPRDQKHLGRTVKNFNEKEWSKVKFDFVVNINRHKFKTHEALRKMLLDTKDLIIAEANPYDTIWGIGLEEHEEDAFDVMKWKGQNLLGKALMKVREELQ